MHSSIYSNLSYAHYQAVPVYGLHSRWHDTSLLSLYFSQNQFLFDLFPNVSAHIKHMHRVNEFYIPEMRCIQRRQLVSSTQGAPPIAAASTEVIEKV